MFTILQGLLSLFCNFIGWIKKHVVLAIFSFLIFVTVWFFNVGIVTQQQFSYYAHSLLHGKLYFLEKPQTWLDAVFYQGNYYWHLGPFPAILLVPFTYIYKTVFGNLFWQGPLQFSLTLGSFILVYSLARRYKYSETDCFFLAFAFCFASVYNMVAFIPWSWYFSQAVTVFFTLLALYEYKNKKRYFLIGLFISFVFLTRVTAGLSVLFFLFTLFWTGKKFSLEDQFSKILSLAAPLVSVIILMFLFNYLRFGNPFTTGYAMSNNHLSEQERFELLNYGLFQLRNIPTNFYYYFINTLDPVLLGEIGHGGYSTYVLKFPYVEVGYPGTNFFIVSPLFLYILKTKLNKKEVNFALLTSFVILFILLLYYWPGWTQIGPRYTLDFLPLLLIPLFYSFKHRKLPLFAKCLIIFSALFNFYLLLTLPFFNF